MGASGERALGSGADVGPDLVVVGAARSGTSYLSSLLGDHPQVDACAVKEPNFFSREIERGPDWYDGLFSERGSGLLRLDASMSYTFPHYPAALSRLHEASPKAFVVYAVRHPVARLLSHFQLHRDYFRNEPARTLGEALASPGPYAGASDYATWVPRLRTLFGPDRLLVVPFPVITSAREELLEVLCDATGLAPEPFGQDAGTAERHRNQVVEFRGRAVLLGRRVVRRSGLYPRVRRVLGPERLRRLRQLLTRPVATETLPEALATCRPEQHDELARLHAAAAEAVSAHLAEQDERLGVSWSRTWNAECPVPGSQGVDW